MQVTRSYPPPVQERIAPGDLVAEGEAAEILGIAVQTLRNWRWQGTGPRWRRVGARLVRYHRADLVAFVECATGEGAA